MPYACWSTALETLAKFSAIHRLTRSRIHVLMLQHLSPVPLSPAPPVHASFLFQDGRFSFNFVGHNVVVEESV
jgi:hypothetical protein